MDQNDFKEILMTLKKDTDDALVKYCLSELFGLLPLLLFGLAIGIIKLFKIL